MHVTAPSGKTDGSLNYDYVVDRVRSLLPGGGKVLDFGCGAGDIIHLASLQAPELEFRGADTFDGLYADWQARVTPQIRSRVSRIVDGVLPYENETFDAVVSNQVFEHVVDIEGALAEIARVLKPGGHFLALFPVLDTWFEPHAGVYFAHWFRVPARQQRYLSWCRRLGFGYYARDASASAWARVAANTIRTECQYRRAVHIRQLWSRHFGSPPRSMGADYVRYRLARNRRTAKLDFFSRQRAATPFLALVCHVRAGVILYTRRSEAP